MRRWIDKGYEPVPISVNVSRMHLKDAEFIYYIEYLLDKYGIEKDLLELEITETIENINANMMVKGAKNTVSLCLWTISARAIRRSTR